MHEEQNGCCKICSRKFKQGVSAHVDHDHDTGEVRGLLCMNCNTGIGKLGDSPMRCLDAVIYLLKTGESIDEASQFLKKISELESLVNQKAMVEQGKLKNSILNIYAYRHCF